MASCTYGKTLLKIENVSLEYDGRPILKKVSAEIKDIIRADCTQGQVVGFLGPSGIGKTQLFRIIAGLNAPTSGRVSVNGLDRPVKAGEVGVVAQDYPLFEHRTVMSNLLLAARQKEKNDKVARDKVIQYLTDFELIDKARLYPVQLSGGQRQRCAIIQQILCSDHFLLMDEPTVGVDPQSRENIFDTIEKLRDQGTTILYTTHYMEDSERLCNHIVIMDEGHIIAMGTLEQLLAMRDQAREVQRPHGLQDLFIQLTGKTLRD